MYLNNFVSFRGETMRLRWSGIDSNDRGSHMIAFNSNNGMQTHTLLISTDQLIQLQTFINNKVKDIEDGLYSTD